MAKKQSSAPVVTKAAVKSMSKSLLPPGMRISGGAVDLLTSTTNRDLDRVAKQSRTNAKRDGNTIQPNHIPPF